MVILKTGPGVKAGGIYKEYISPAIAHPQQTTGAITYTINHNFGVEGGPDFVKCYERYDTSYQWHHMGYVDRPGYVYNQNPRSLSSPSEKNSSRVDVYRFGGGYIQFRAFKFSDTENT